MSSEAEEVAERQVMAVSISSPGRSLASNKGARERASAMRCVFPGVHLTLKLNKATFSHIRCSLGLGRLNKSLRKRPSRGRWSLSTRKVGRPFKKNAHFCIAHMMAKHSNSIVEYLCRIVVSPFEPHLTILKISFPA